MSPSLRTVRFLLALALLLGPGLVPMAAAQQVPTEPEAALCFDRDPDPTPVGPGPQPPSTGQAGVCPGGDPVAPDYDEGDRVGIFLANFRRETAQATQPWIRVTCRTGCLDDPQGEREYWSRWDGTRGQLFFPTDFRMAGPSGLGRDALADLAPRTNGTWEVVAFMPTGAELKRTFNVWLFTIYNSHNQTVHAGEEHLFKSSGVAEGTPVDFRIERRVLTGWVQVPLARVPATVDPDRVFRYVWNVPLNETARLGECPLGVTHCYRAIVHYPDGSKPDENITFRVAPAHIVVTPLTVTDAGGDPQARERTHVVTVAVDLHYPGGRLGRGPELTPDRLPPPPPGEDRSIRMRVERTNLTGTERPVPVADMPLKYDARLGRWEASWTIPRDLDVYVQSTFRVELPTTYDQWGNVLAARPISNYTIDRATLIPIVTHENATLARTHEATVRVDVRYHNGTPLTDLDLKWPLLGCFVQASSPIPCANTTAAGVQKGEYRDGVWLFKKTYPRDYANLGEHAFVLLGGADAEDRWGNRVNRTRSEPMNVVAASPRIDFSTIMRGRSVTTMERGESIQVLATITYGDGRPYNHTVRVNDQLPESHVLIVNLTKRGQDLHSVTPLELREVDAERGLWQGSLSLTLDDANTPTGIWTFAFDVRDNLTTPNLNQTSFDRTIVAAALRFRPERLTNPVPSTNGNVAFIFKLQYISGADVTGTAVRPNEVYAQVYRFDAKNRTHVGQPLSNLIYPQWDHPDARGAWSLRYQVPPHLFSGPYVFVIKGRDASGNALPEDAYSPTFTPYSPTIQREVITPPALTVARGEDATIVVAAQDGDVGIDGTGKPAIMVERWNDVFDRWDPAFGGTDVRQADADIANHVGMFPVTPTTPIGTYRFHLLGRDATLRIIEAYSRNFTIQPTEVTRAVIIPPPETATKGTTVHMTLEYRSGDRITSVVILERLRPTTLAPPQSVIQGDRLNVTWEIPVEVPNGNYTIRFRGLDQYGNEIVIDSPPIEAHPAQLEGKVLGSPPRVVERGSKATFLFGITYPNGAFYSSITMPSVFVYNASGLAGSATVELRGVTYEATWSAPQSAGDAEYWFETAGQAFAGNNLPILRSASFRLAPGTFDRPASADLDGAYERMATVNWAVPVQASDRNVAFRVAYYGTGSDVSAALAGKPPTLSNTIPHSVDAESGRYVARWVTDEVTPVGVYRLFMEGQDTVGNRILAQSTPTLLKTTAIVVQIQEQPEQSDFGEGKALVFRFNAIYKTGPLFDDTKGRPTVQMLVEGFPVTQQPTLAYSSGFWTATWQAPATLTPGTYTLSVSGFDNAGNQIARASSVPYRFEASLRESFAKTVPGVDVPVMLLGLAALALALGASRRRA